MIVYKTDLDKIPNNCKECKCYECTISQKRTKLGNLMSDIDEKYHNKRHESCPLLEIKE